MQKLIAVACVACLMTGPAHAATPTSVTEAVALLQEDSLQLSRWVTGQFKEAVPYNSTAGNVVPSQLKIFGISVGVSAVVSASDMDTNALHNMNTSIVNTREIDTFDKLPMPMILGMAKIGLPFGLDAGIRLGGIPKTESDEGDTHMEVQNKVVGLDLRKKLIEEGITRPFGLTLGVNYTHADGHIQASTPYTSETTDVTFSADSKGVARTEWKTDSVGLQAILNKKILFMNPYIGASVNKNFGDVETSITNSGTVTYVPGSTSAALPGTPVTAKEDVKSADLRALLGLEFTFLPFMKLGIHGELANQGKMAGSIGLRIQFR